MMGTINCTYETPCGWCTKWDKKCDNRTPKRYRNPVIISCKDKDLEDIKSGQGLPSTDVRELFKEPWRSNVP